MERTPLVSIVMPTYHQPQYIETAVKSILLQTHKNIQLIVVMVKDDMPTFDALQNVRYDIGIVVSEKADHIYQMNLGLKEAKGDFLILFGSDDFMLPNKVEHEMHVATATNAVLVYSRFFIADEHLNIGLIPPMPPFSYERLTRGNFMADSSLVAKSMYEEFGFLDESLGSLAVYDMWLHIAEKYERRIIFNPIPTCIYRTHLEQKHTSRIQDPKQLELYEQIVKASLQRKGLPTDGVKFGIRQVEYERV